MCCSRHDVTPITMAVIGAAAYPQALQALNSMLSRNALNPADISVLYRNYSAAEPPPLDLIRIPQFLGAVTFTSNSLREKIDFSKNCQKRLYRYHKFVLKFYLLI